MTTNQRPDGVTVTRPKRQNGAKPDIDYSTIDPAKLTADQIDAAVYAGVIDTHWDAHMAAMLHRVKKAAGGVEWHISFRGLEVSKRDLTMGDMRLAQRIAGKPYSTFDVINDADSQVAVLAAVLVRMHGMKLAEAHKAMEEATVDEVDGAFSLVSVAPPEEPPFVGPTTP